jgi:archaellum component FlaF (FlaF/FlaG flagellin family)
MNLQHRVMAAVAMIALAPFAYASTYYVNCHSWGDSWPSNSQSTPFLTLKKAASVLQSGDTLLLYRGCIWEEPLPVISGVKYADYGNASDGKPVVRGSHDLSAFTWNAYTSANGTTGIFVADLSSLPANVYNQAFESIEQVYYAGNRMYRARHPNVNTRYLNTTNKSNVSNSQLLVNSTDWPTGSTDMTGATARIVFGGYYLRDFKVTGVLAAGSQYTLQQMPFDAYHFASDMFHNDFPTEGESNYWLENKLWMLDAEYEWFYDASTKKLYVKLPGSITPKNANIYGTVKYTGMDPSGINCATTCSSVSISNIEVRETMGDGVFFKGGDNITLNGLVVTRPGGRGIAFPGTSNSTVQNSQVTSSLREGIWMGDVKYQDSFPGQGNYVTGNTIKSAGIGLYAVAAIQTGYGDTVSNNYIYTPTYSGVMIAKQTGVTGNYIENACYDFGDCAALYTTNSDETYSPTVINGKNEVPAGYPLNVSISNNVVNGTNTSAAPNLGMKNGIYLDGLSRNVNVTNNFVASVDNGIFLNSAGSNSITGNVFFKSNSYEMVSQETPGFPKPYGCTYYIDWSCHSSTSNDYAYNNTVSGNTFVHASGMPVIKITSAVGSTSDFGTFSSNKYVNLNYDRIIYDWPIPVRPPQVMTLNEWRTAGQVAGQVPGPDDNSASQFNNLLSDSSSVGATNYVLNGDFAIDDVGELVYVQRLGFQYCEYRLRQWWGQLQFAVCDIDN